MRTALVHDALVSWRGGERVFEEMAAVWPEADIFTLALDRAVLPASLRSRSIRTSALQYWPGARAILRRASPWLPLFTEQHDLRGYDLIVSSSQHAAFGILPDPGARHVCYLHAPWRAIWDPAPDAGDPGRAGPLARRLWPWRAQRLRQWAVCAAPRVDHFVANSAATARRLRRFLGRDAQILHPPARTDFFTLSERSREDYDLIVSGLTPHKNLELALRAFSRLNRRLVVIGSGPLRGRLRALGRRQAHVITRASDEALRDHYRRCRALVVPGEEDFGLAPLEANACGAPVIGLARGGLLETQKPGETAVFFTEPTEEALAAAVLAGERMPWNSARIRARAEAFTPECFRESLAALVGGLVRS